MHMVIWLCLPVEEVKCLKYHSFRLLTLSEAPFFPFYYLRIISTNHKNNVLRKNIEFNFFNILFNFHNKCYASTQAQKSSMTMSATP